MFLQNWCLHSSDFENLILSQVDKSQIKTELADVAKENTEIRNIT